VTADGDEQNNNQTPASYYSPQPLLVIPFLILSFSKNNIPPTVAVEPRVVGRHHSSATT
jgi:hypothetical protein